MLTMRKVIQARIYKGEQYYVAEALDLAIVTQGATLDEVTRNLKEAIALHLEGENLAELGFEPQPAVLASFEIDAALTPR